MLAVGTLPRWPKGKQPPIVGVGAEFVQGGVRVFLLHAARNRSRATSIPLRLYNADGELVHSCRVVWPGLSDGEWKDVTLEYAE